MGNGFLDDIFHATVRVVTSDSATGANSIGTGFLFQTLIHNGTKKALFLISNKHVLNNNLHEIALAFNKRDANGEVHLGNTLTLAEKNFQKACVNHPNPDVDLCCIEITEATNPKFGLFLKFLSDSQLYDESNMVLHPGKEVFFIGYPDNRFDTVHNLPILRRGYIASRPDIDFNGEPQFVVDAPVFPGSSGSPVFAESSNYFKLIGVITATMIKNEQLRTIQVAQPVATTLGVQQAIGLGIVIKTKALTELLDVAKKQAEQVSKHVLRF